MTLALIAFPWALAAAVAVPGLMAIYWLRNRHRRVEVSSLLLWFEEREAREGGRRVNRLRTTPLFWLELAAIVLLVAAAIDPRWTGAGGGVPVWVVLDDSFSMRAGDDSTARERGEEALQELLDDGGVRVRFVLAGKMPRLTGGAVRSWGAAADQLRLWRCESTTADIDSAVALVERMASRRDRILVVTDHAPKQPVAGGRMRWEAVGKPERNTAFVGAHRTDDAEGARLLLEIAGFGPDDAPPAAVGLRVNDHATGELIREVPLRLPSNRTHRLHLALGADLPAITLQLPDDALSLDNTCTLLPQHKRRVPVEVTLGSKALQDCFDRAIDASGRAPAAPLQRTPLLRITDVGGSAPAGAEEATWTVRVHAADEAVSFAGPYVIDRAHPIARGLQLQGVLWGAPRKTELPGLPVVSAGNVPLLTDVSKLDGTHTLHLHLTPELSTVQQSPAWPVLVWNLLEWRAAHAPGVRSTNVRQGTDIWFMPPRDAAASLRRPDQSRQPLPASREPLALTADQVGVWRIETDDRRWDVAVNPLHATESDLSNARTGTWGRWSEGDGWQEYSLAPWFLLAALGVLGIHQWLAGRTA